MCKSVLECTGSYFRTLKIEQKNQKISTFFSRLIMFSVIQLFGSRRLRFRVPMQYAGNRSGYVEREREGSTGPSRGEQRLTVHRAHASRGESARRIFEKLFYKNEDISRS